MRTIPPQCHRAAWLGCGAFALLLAACSHDKQPAQDASTLAPVAANEPAESQRVGDGGTTIHLSPEILQECRFPANPDELPLFDVDAASLKPRGRDILADVANCMKQGPLEGRTITIIGRADARGTDDHNHALGANRANATRNYLVAQGVTERKLLVISRGEEGASGNDEESMARDRRVDLVLGDATERASINEYPAADQKRQQPTNHASSYSDQSEGGPASGKVTGSSGPGTDSVPGK